jgi:hypothetical protein
VSYYRKLSSALSVDIKDFLIDHIRQAGVTILTFDLKQQPVRISYNGDSTALPLSPTIIWEVSLLPSLPENFYMGSFLYWLDSYACLLLLKEQIVSEFVASYLQE